MKSVDRLKRRNGFVQIRVTQTWYVQTDASKKSAHQTGDGGADKGCEDRDGDGKEKFFLFNAGKVYGGYIKNSFA